MKKDFGEYFLEVFFCEEKYNAANEKQTLNDFNNNIDSFIWN